jgi:hypothetical protein
MQWLRYNSAAIQAFATVVLVVITGVYVSLTRRLAMVATAQLLALDRTRKDKQAELDAMVDRLREWLLPLPESESSPDGRTKIQDATPLGDFEFGRFCTLASELGVIAGKLAATTQASVQFLTQVIGQVRDPAPAHPYRWETAFPSERWIEAHRKAGEALIALKAQLAPREEGSVRWQASTRQLGFFSRSFVQKKLLSIKRSLNLKP